MSKSEILDRVKAHPSQKVKYAVADIDGVLRGKVVHVNKFLSSVESGAGFCDVVFGWDSSDSLYENGHVTGWHTGFPDGQTRVDLETFRQVPWEEDVPFFLGDFTNSKGEPLPICPRNLLRKISKQTSDMGYESIFAQEFEWFNFQETSESLHERGFHNPCPITKGMFGYSVLRSSQQNGFFSDLFDLLLKFDVPLEGLHTETGPGVYEAAIIYTDVLEAADRATLFKTAVKEIAHKHGIMPTFMAKWSDDYPGCGGHLHQSLWRDAKNVFYDPDDENGMSEIMKSYIAGMLHCLPEILPMYAPTTNSFKRLVEGAWAPTTLTWGIDNRTVAVRALPGGKKSTRIEMRVPASDVNPYLAMSASLASGMYGVKNNLKLKVSPTQGNGYENTGNGTMPTDLKDANERMRRSEVARDMFGDSFVDHFTMTREWEWKQAQKSVTDWELKRYFEII